MAKKKEKTVVLEVPHLGLTQAFGIPHAERLLDMGVELNGGWVLPATSEYQYDDENGLRLKANQGNTAKTV